MIIAIDYDGTYERFPYQFNKLRENFQEIGAEVYIVTARCENTEKIMDDLSKFDKIIYTCNKAKASVVNADVFIDDNPVTLCCDMLFNDDETSGTPSNNLYQIYDNEHWNWHWKTDKFEAVRI